MNPAGRLSLALVTSLALSFPVIGACLRGDVDLLTVSTRYLVAFVLTWAGISAVAHLFESYTAAMVTAPVTESDGHADASQPQRRADDEPSTAGAS